MILILIPIGIGIGVGIGVVIPLPVGIRVPLPILILILIPIPIGVGIGIGVAIPLPLTLPTSLAPTGVTVSWRRRSCRPGFRRSRAGPLRPHRAAPLLAVQPATSNQQRTPNNQRFTPAGRTFAAGVAELATGRRMWMGNAPFMESGQERGSTGDRVGKSDSAAVPILDVRGVPVLIDADLARLFGVPTRALNQAVRRNSARFPSDFCFQLSAGEKDEVITACDHLRSLRFSKALPHAFTEHGALMAANVLNSPEAVKMSVFIIRAFVRQREALSANAAVLQRLAEIDRTLLLHDTALHDLYRKLLPLLQPPPDPPRPRIGFGSSSAS